MADLSEHWNTELGEIVCRSCGRRWPCHFSAWLMGNDGCRFCGGRMEWRTDE